VGDLFLELRRRGGAGADEAVADLYRLRCENAEAVIDLLERYGNLPLPPYITHSPDAVDETRYQTVYARAPGAVAAPTAGLHFDADMLALLAQQGVASAHVTLHVGAGTFQPVRAENIAEHKMHSEWYTVPQQTVDAIARTKAQGGRVMAVGTTSLRALESAALGGELRAGQKSLRLETARSSAPEVRFAVQPAAIGGRSRSVRVVSLRSEGEKVRLVIEGIAGDTAIGFVRGARGVEPVTRQRG